MRPEHTKQYREGETREGGREREFLNNGPPISPKLAWAWGPRELCARGGAPKPCRKHFGTARTIACEFGVVSSSTSYHIAARAARGSGSGSVQ